MSDIQGSSTLESRIEMMQGAMRLCAVSALFCAQPETLGVFREYVKANKLYPEHDWITPPVLGKASIIVVEHSNVGEQVKNLKSLLDILGRPAT